jgi:hypothetical protein
MRSNDPDLHDARSVRSAHNTSSTGTFMKRPGNGAVISGGEHPMLYAHRADRGTPLNWEDL